MKKMLCIIQENMFSDAEIKSIELGLKQLYKEHYNSSEKLLALWMIMPEGYAFSERKKSEATVIMIEVDRSIDQEKREELMGKASQFLLNNFRVSPLDSLITLANSSFVNDFFNAQRNRIRPFYRPYILGKMIFKALYSKWFNGYYKLAVKL